MDPRLYASIFQRHQRTQLGILPDQRPSTPTVYRGAAFDVSLPQFNFDAGLDFVKKHGITDIFITEDYRMIFSGPAAAIYKLSPRAVIEGEQNKYFGYPEKKALLSFWTKVSEKIAGKTPVKFQTLEDLVSGPYAPSVIPHPGIPDTNFYSVANNAFYEGVKSDYTIDLCKVNGGQQYSSHEGPIAIKSPAGEIVSVMHSANIRDLDRIIPCGGLAWTSFAVNQGLHDWPANITFYLDARILLNNLDMEGYSPRRQKAVHIAAWDNWTLRAPDYSKFQKVYTAGMRRGESGTGFIAAEYLAAGLDTTKFEDTPILELKAKGAVPQIHNWDELDDALLNLTAARSGKPIASRFKGAKYETHGVNSYVELKVIDLIPLKDIPLAVIQVQSANTSNSTPEVTEAIARDTETRLRMAGFKGKIITVSYRSRQYRKQVVDDAVENLYVNNPKKYYVEASQSATSGRAIPRVANYIKLPSGLIMSDVEVTQSLYELVMGSNPSSFKGLNNPVENVTWFNAVEFCNKLTDFMNSNFGHKYKKAYTIKGENVTWDRNADGFRLPTETEWEYAAMGGGKKDPYGKIDEIAWYSSNSDSLTHPVAQKNPNKYKMYDMLGNVYEWCWTADGSYRVFRGGSWGNFAWIVRAGLRDGRDPGTRTARIGFRVCRNSPGYTPIGD